jgi:hypothetical protein
MKIKKYKIQCSLLATLYILENQNYCKLLHHLWRTAEETVGTYLQTI